MQRAGTVDFKDALPWLVSARQAGTLVPFVGAGMSMPYCKGWVAFIQALCEHFNQCDLAKTLDPKPAAGGEAAPVSPEMLYRVADRVASWLRLLPAAERRASLVAALRATETMLPGQLAVLSSVSWPLIVTTNYDDLILTAIEAAGSRKPLVLGRAPTDSADIVRSLDGLQQPIVWHVQGHVPGVTGREEDELSPELEALLEQVVLGHQQYQQAINAEPAFRRAFAEVFRRRSLLFLGSGLTESYVVNLLSEALFSFGPSPHSHYALLTEKEAERVDPEFLAVRLGITPVVYGTDHNELVGAIKNLVTPEPEQDSPRLPIGLSSLTFRVRPPSGGHPIEVCLRHEALSAAPSAENGCVILSVGLDRDTQGFFTQIARGPQANAFLRSYRGGQYALTGRHDFDPVDQRSGDTRAPHRVFQLVRNGTREPVFLASSTAAAEGDRWDERDLQTITDVTRQALQVAARDFSEVTMGLMGAGDLRPFDPAYCLLALLCGIRTFLEEPEKIGRLRRIEVCILADEAWLPLAQGRLPAAELLSSGLARVLVRIFDNAGRYEEFALSVPHSTTIRDVLRHYGYRPESLDVSAYPLTKRMVAAASEAVLKTRVFPGMQVELRPASAGKISGTIDTPVGVATLGETAQAEPAEQLG